MITPEQYAKSNTEHSHAVALMMFIGHAKKVEPQLKWLFAIPNGGLRSKVTASNLKAEGVRRGVSDYFLPVPRIVTKQLGYIDVEVVGCCGLFIELKRIKSVHRKAGIEGTEQEVFREYVTGNGYKAVVAYGWRQAVYELCNYLSIDQTLLDLHVASCYKS